ncbi:hypothetical protein GCM10025864_39480 [Luteimicrobium album]|uniref:Uncharacterized protein n=1 Tax=Luteimicrobium album TaxID=1054550 RepID=A0ABQ6I859_9MICO|nr:hypothetical protein [Luteimicrobium album]GMA26189.1 hypothetical protein GCM10025864_39480 [Luteimicrobium album]
MGPDDILRLTALMAQKIRDRRPTIAESVAYYKGTEGRLKFASEEFKLYFQKRFEGLSDNWCMPVAQAPIERIRHQGIRLAGEDTADTSLAETWERNDAERGLSEALLMMTIAKRSFALVSPSPSAPGSPSRTPTPAPSSTTRQRASARPVSWSGRTTSSSTASSICPTRSSPSSGS